MTSVEGGQVWRAELKVREGNEKKGENQVRHFCSPNRGMPKLLLSACTWHVMSYALNNGSIFLAKIHPSALDAEESMKIQVKGLFDFYKLSMACHHCEIVECVNPEV